MRRLTAPRALAPLRHRTFRLLAAGQVASNLGDACYAVALPWYVLAAHGGPVLLGTVLAAYGIPRTALIAAGGYACDRWGPQTVMMATDLARAAAVAALAVTATLGPARAAALIPIAIVLGAGEGLFLPGSFAIIPSLVPGEDLQPANALSSGGTQMATLLGPAFGGALVTLSGPSLAFALDAVTFVISAATLAGLRAVPRPAPRTAGRAAPRAANLPGTIPASHDASGRGPGLLAVFRAERVLQLMVPTGSAISSRSPPSSGGRRRPFSGGSAASWYWAAAACSPHRSRSAPSSSATWARRPSSASRRQPWPPPSSPHSPRNPGVTSARPRTRRPRRWH